MRSHVIPWRSHMRSCMIIRSDVMKNALSLIMMVILFVSLVACGTNENNKSPNVSGNKNDQTDISQEEQQEEKPGKQEQKKYENESFKDVEMKKSENKLVVTGKARVFEGVFQYAIINGDDVLKQDKCQTEGAPAWGEFEISFDKEIVMNEGTKLELFFLSAKDGSKTNTLTIPLN